MDETTGTVAYDASGNANNGTNSGATLMAAGKRNYAYTFDGSSSYVDMGDMPSTESQSQLSWAFWVKPNSLSTTDCLLCKANNSGGQYAWTAQTGAGDSTKILGSVDSTGSSGNDYAQTPAGMLVNGTWTHVVMVFDGTQGANATKFKIYVNGIQKTLDFSGTVPSATVATTSNVRMGATADGNRYFNGLLDDVKIWNYALTAQQVKTEYTGGAVKYGN
jgi:hypothetical protein